MVPENGTKSHQNNNYKNIYKKAQGRYVKTMGKRLMLRCQVYTYKIANSSLSFILEMSKYIAETP